MQIEVGVIKTVIGGVDMYKPDYVGDYKVISYSNDKTTCLIEVNP